MQVAANGSAKAAVTGAIRTAAQATGASFNYLLATAKVESNLDPGLTMRSSTATGLFQFLEQTWLGVLKQAGPALGYGRYAAAITQTRSGRYEVADPALRQEIMQLRKDPTANAVMGAAFTQQNAALMTQRIGRAPSESELYIGHFFGPYAGSRAINLAQSNPNAIAADIFPAAARANRPIFYDKQGNARTVAGVCADLSRRYQAARASAAPLIAKAAIFTPPRPPAPVPSAPADTASAVQAVVQPPAPTGLNDLMFSPAPLPTLLAFANEPPTPRAETFRSLFQAAERRTAVSPVVAELWSGPQSDEGHSAQVTAASPPTGEQRGAPRRSTLDLFRDTDADVRALFGNRT